MWVITKEVLTCSLTGRPAVALGFYSRLVCIFERRKTLFLSRLPSPKVRVGKGFSRVMTRPAGRVRGFSKCHGSGRVGSGRVMTRVIRVIHGSGHQDPQVVLG